MMDERKSYFTVYTGGEGLSEEKKSRFLGVTAHVESEEEALAFVESIRKQHYDARHHCFAYVTGRQGESMRAADDGEPQGTAGRPMLDLLTGAGLRDSIVVVTRYFGGTLLGTGGLVRNYSAAAQDAIVHSVIIEKKPGTRMALRAGYTEAGKLQYLFGSLGIPVMDTVYTDAVTYDLIVPAQQQGRFEKALAEATAGRADLEDKGPVYYAEAGGQMILD